MEKPALVIMAAGMGSRYGGLKQIDPLGPNGEMILDYSIHDALLAGFGKVVFVIKREMEELFHQKIGSRFSERLEVAYAFQEMEDLPGGFLPPEGRQRPWGTGHAVYAARKAVSGPFSVINADDFLGRDSFLQLGDFFRKGCTGEALAMVGFPLCHTLSGSGGVSRGVCQAEKGFLRAIVERGDIRRDCSGVISWAGPENRLPLPDKTPVSMNVWALHSDLFSWMEADLAQWLEEGAGDPMKREYFLPAFIDRMISAGKVSVALLETRSKWYGVTYQADREQMAQTLAAFYQEGRYPALR